MKERARRDGGDASIAARVSRELESYKSVSAFTAARTSSFVQKDK